MLWATPSRCAHGANGRLTEALSYGVNACLFGSGRIGEDQPGGWAHNLGAALGSVRQLVDASASMTLDRSYEPFGEPQSSAGAGTSIIQSTNEQTDATELVYLRARNCEPSVGRLAQRAMRPRPGMR